MKKTIIDLFENSVKQYPDNPFLWEKTRDAFEPTTYKEVQQQVYAAGAGLIALGVKKGDNMALLSEGRNAWIIGELAMFYAGATNVPLSIKLEEANDLHHATREAVAHAPDHGAANPDEDGVSEEGRPRAGGRTCEGQQDAAGDIERVVAQGVGSEALGRYQVVGGDGGSCAQPTEDRNCER